eukprot:7894570-Karenia_brevis.AAC.1
MTINPAPLQTKAWRHMEQLRITKPTTFGGGGGGEKYYTAPLRTKYSNTTLPIVTGCDEKYSTQTGICLGVEDSGAEKHLSS